MNSKKKYELSLEPQEPDNLKPLTLMKWFNKRTENIEDNELRYENIHNGNRLSKVHLKSDLLRINKDEVAEPVFTLHNSIKENQESNCRNKYVNFKYYDDVLREIQPPHLKIVNKRNRRKLV